MKNQEIETRVRQALERGGAKVGAVTVRQLPGLDDSVQLARMRIEVSLPGLTGALNMIAPVSPMLRVLDEIQPGGAEAWIREQAVMTRQPEVPA